MVDPVWLSAVAAIAAVIVSIIALVISRGDKSKDAVAEHGQRIHKNELATERLRGDCAEKYATKHELREAVDDLKSSINGRFDRLENKLDKERETS